MFPTICEDDLCDLGHLYEGESHFHLGTYCCYYEFAGKISAGEAMRIGIELHADNYASPRPEWFEVTWDGQWSSESAEMQQHVKIAKTR